MSCLVLSLPSVKRNFDELTKITGNKEIAYAVLAANNGYSMEQTGNGKVSELYNSLEKLTGSKTKATILKARIYSSEFISKFGDWQNSTVGSQDINGEPSLFIDANGDYFIGKNNTKIPLTKSDIAFNTKSPIKDFDLLTDIHAQFTPETSGPIQKGSVISVDTPLGGSTKYIVTEVDPKSGKILQAFNPSFPRGELTTPVSALSFSSVNKIGSWNIIEIEDDGVKKEIIVTAPNRIVDITSDLKFDESEPLKQQYYVKLAAENGKNNSKSSTSSISKYVNNSGGAVGSDSAWDEIGREFGMVNNRHYYHGAKTPKGNSPITEEEFNEGKQKVLLANKTLKRKPDRYMDLLARNWMQVKNSEAVFAIIEGFDIVKIGEGKPSLTHSTGIYNFIVKGGTGWAVQMAIDSGKTVYVFDQNAGKWLKGNSTLQTEINTPINVFTEIETPVLTKNFAGIGTRKINDKGLEAIWDVYDKSTKGIKEPEITTIEQKVIDTADKFGASQEVTSTVQGILNEDMANAQSTIESFAAMPLAMFNALMSKTYFKGKSQSDIEMAHTMFKYLYAGEEVTPEEEETVTPEETTLEGGDVSPMYSENDNVFLHAESSVELESLNKEISQAIKDGVKTFIVFPTDMQNKFDKSIIKSLVDKGWIYKTKQDIAYMAKPMVKVPTQQVEETEEQKPSVKPSTLYKPGDTQLKPGSVVECAFGNKPMDTYLVWSINDSGKIQMIAKDGSKIPYTPTPDKVKVIGSYPTVTYNGVQYVVADNDDIYSAATGKKVYTSQDNSSKVQRQRIMDMVNIQPKVVKKVIERSESNGPVITVNGITIDLRGIGLPESFKLSDDQLDAVTEFAKWLSSDNSKPFAVEGIAGTGKTTVLRILREYVRASGKVAEFTALTHPATIELEMAAGSRAKTLHSVLGYEPDADLDNSSSLKFEKRKGSSVARGSILFVDEASMASAKMTKDLLDTANRAGVRVVFVGNLSQLPPVGETDNDIVFNKNRVQLVTLKQVMRQGVSNPAMPFYKYLSEEQDTGFRTEGLKVQLFNTDSKEGIYWITDEELLVDRAVKSFKKSKQLDSYRYARVLAYTNWKVSEYNTKIRAALGMPLGSVLSEGNESADEVVTFDINTNDIRKGIPYKVKSVESVMETFLGVELPVLKVTMEPGFNYIVDKEQALTPNIEVTVYNGHAPGYGKEVNSRVRQYIDSLKEIERTAIESTIASGDNKAYKEFLSLKNSLMFMFDINDSEGKSFIKAQVNYFYASTIHKAQGATYDVAYIDEQNAISTITKHLNKEGTPTAEQKRKAYMLYNKLLYTAVTRARKMSLVKTTGGIKNIVDEEVEQKLTDPNSEISLNSMTAPVNSLEQGAVKYMNAMGLAIEDHIVPVKSIQNTQQGVALATAVPEAVLVDLPTSPVIARANEKLMLSIATDENDPRIMKYTNTNDIDLYNRFVYDIYVHSVRRDLASALMNSNESAANEIAFNVNHTFVNKKLSREIKELERQHIEIKNSGGSFSETQPIIEAIQKKKDLKDNMAVRGEIETLVDMSVEDLSKVEDLVNKPDISANEFNESMEILKTWIEVGNFEDPDNNIALLASEANDPGYQDLFREISTRAESLMDRLNKKGKNLFVNNVSRILNRIFKFEDVVALNNKIHSMFGKWVLSIAKVDNPITGYIMKLVNKANTMANTKAIRESRLLADLYKTLKDKKYDISTFWQRDEHGIITGNLVSEYSSYYLKSIKRIRNNKAKLSLLHNLAIVIDPVEAATNTKKYIDLLSKELGEDIARKNVLEAKENYRKYFEIRNAFMSAEFGHTDESKLTAEQKSTLDIWENENDPQLRHMQLTDSEYKNSKYEDLYTQSGERFLVIVPRKYDSKGIETANYDSNYYAIQSDPDAKKFYDMAEKITMAAKDNFNDGSMSEYSLAHVSNTALQQLNQLGVKEFVRKELVDYFAAGFDREVTIDPLTGKPIKDITKNVTTLDKAIMQEYGRLRNIKHGNKPIKSEAERIALLKEASDNVMKHDRNDIFMALNTLNLASLSYAFKSQIKPQIDMAMHYINDMKGLSSREQIMAAIRQEKSKPNPNKHVIQKLEKSLNNSGRNFSFRNVDQEDVNNALEMLNYFMDKEYYDIANEDRSFKIGRKMYTKAEKDEKVKLETQLEELRNEKDKDYAAIAKAEARLNSLGRQMSTGNLLKMLMDALRITALGWNMQSAIANLFQGQIANLIYAADGTYYTYSDLKNAYKILLSERGKFNNLIHNYAILGDIMYDFAHKSPFEEKRSWVGNLKRLFKPFEGNRIAETANQGNLMIAMMLHMKLKNKNTGEEVNMWEAVNDDGTINPDYEYEGHTGEDAISEAIIKVREQVAIIHGDYTNAKLAQKYQMGKAALLFKIWFFDPFMARFGQASYNYQLQKYTKGRFVSYVEFLRDYGFNYMKFHRDYREGKVSELDYKNMRVAHAEVMIGLTTYLIQALVRATLCEDSSSNSKCGGRARNYIVNSLKRIDQETRTFISPKGYYDVFSNPMSILAFLKRASTTVAYVDGMIWEGKSWENREGENKFLKLWGRTIPGWSQFKGLQEITDEVRTY